MRCFSDKGYGTEFDFVVSMDDRQPGECRGPMVTLGLTGMRLYRLQAGLRDEAAAGLLFSGLDNAVRECGNESLVRLTFSLCAAHWFYLSFVLGVHAHESRRADWFAEANLLLTDLCLGAGWDIKELANMVRWREVDFT